MTFLSRLTKLGGAKETTQGTYVAPTFSIPWDTAEYSDVIDPLRDESVRANDSVLQGLTQGPLQTSWALTLNAYPDILGNFLVAMGLFDTVTGGVSTTLSAGTSAGATSITTVASIPVALTIRITSTAGTDYAVTGTPSGSGPYTIPITTPAAGLTYAHLSADPVVAQYTHTFKQNRTFATTWPSYSFTTDEGVDSGRGWAGCVAQELAVKIDPKTLVKISPKFTGWPSASQATFGYAASTAQPPPGWGWTVTNGSPNAASTRGLTMDFTFKRSGEAIHASSGLQGPREVFAGALEVDGTYKAIFENLSDMNLFRQYLQTPTTHTLTQQLAFGGSTLALTMSQSGYITAKVANSGPHLQLDMTLAGIQNATDTGVTSVVLKNYNVAAY